MGASRGTILGTGSVAKAGAGTQVLSGNNTYSGGTRFVAGVLEVPLNNSLGDTAGGLTFDGGTLRTTGSFTTTRTTITPGRQWYDRHRRRYHADSRWNHQRRRRSDEVRRWHADRSSEQHVHGSDDRERRNAATGQRGATRQRDRCDRGVRRQRSI